MPTSGTASRTAFTGAVEAIVPLIEAHDLYRFYHSDEDETLALRGVSFAADPGELIAIMGPSGSGKSTLLACLAGLDEPDGGYVVIQGHRLSHRPESERAKIRASMVGLVLQSGNLIEHLTLVENIRLQQHFAKTAAPALASDQMLQSVGLSGRGHAYASQLSGGESARAALAVALAAAPPLLLADEPTGEVDEQTETTIIALLKQHCRRGGVAILATHSQALAAQADSRLHILDGQFVSA